MRIYHITNLNSALNIIEKKEFIPVSTDVYNADACLNCFCSMKQGYNYGQRFQGKGVVLVLDWSGEIQQINMNAFPPFNNNILYNQQPWRCFIPTNTRGNNLKVINIYFDKYHLNSYLYEKLDLSLWSKLLPKKYRNKYVKKMKLKFIFDLRQKIMQNDCYLDIL